GGVGGAARQEGGGLGGGDDLRGSMVEVVGRDDVEAGFDNDILADLDIGAFEPHDQWHLEPDLLDGGDHPRGDDVAAHDTAEDVDQDAGHLRDRGDDLERRAHALLGYTDADVDEIRGPTAVELDDAHGGHREARAVDQAADRAVERDVIEVVTRSGDLFFVLFAEIAQRDHLGVAVERVVVEGNLGVEADQRAGLGQHQRVDLEQAHVLGEKRRIELGQDAPGLHGGFVGQSQGADDATDVMRQEPRDLGAP